MPSSQLSTVAHCSHITATKLSNIKPKSSELADDLIIQGFRCSQSENNKHIRSVQNFHIYELVGIPLGKIDQEKAFGLNSSYVAKPPKLKGDLSSKRQTYLLEISSAYKPLIESIQNVDRVLSKLDESLHFVGDRQGTIENELFIQFEILVGFRDWLRAKYVALMDESKGLENLDVKQRKFTLTIEVDECDFATDSDGELTGFGDSLTDHFNQVSSEVFKTLLGDNHANDNVQINSQSIGLSIFPKDSQTIIFDELVKFESQKLAEQKKQAELADLIKTLDSIGASAEHSSKDIAHQLDETEKSTAQLTSEEKYLARKRMVLADLLIDQ